jgi:hypothetical protein
MPDPQPIPADDAPATDLDHKQLAEIERLDRRRQVLFLRGRRMSVKAIADVLKTNPNAVCRDLEWIRKHGAEVFGSHPEFDATAFIWESLCRFEDIESTALRDSMTADIAIRDKMLCLAEAREARKCMIELLLDTGQLQRAPVSVNVNLPSAAQIRAAIAAATAEEGDVIDMAPAPMPLLQSDNGHDASGNGQG